MKCRNCGTEIADKALICYRCGEPTATPRVQPPVEPAARGWLPVCVAMVLLIAVGVIVLPLLASGPPRWAGWAALVLAVLVALWRLKPTKRRGRRS